MTRLAFLGTPPAAVPTLRALVGAGHEVVLVVSRADKRRGRGGPPVPSAVKLAALEIGLPVSDRVEDTLDSGAELGVVVAFGRLIKPHVLSRLPMLNVHFSLLPRWRGAAPVERAILAGDTETGVCVMALDEGLDTGPVFARRSVTIGEEETAAELRERLARVGTDLLVSLLAEPCLPTPMPQEGEATYAAKVQPGELRLDWSLPAADLHRLVRVGRAWTTVRGKRLLVLSARVVGTGPPTPGAMDGTVVGTGEGGLELLGVQQEGRSRVTGEDWARGARLAAGERLGS